MASLSTTNCQILLKLISIKLVMPSKHLTFPTTSPSHQQAYARLRFLHQWADRGSKKNHIDAKTNKQNTLQNDNHDKKAESFVPDEGTV